MSTTVPAMLRLLVGPSPGKPRTRIAAKGIDCTSEQLKLKLYLGVIEVTGVI